MPRPIPDDQQLAPIETASVDELRTLQLQRLQWSVRHAYDNVEHYRKALETAQVHPDDIRSLEDLYRLPFTTTGDPRENYRFGMFAVPREQVVRIHASSGTTGKPTVVGYTCDDLDMWAAVMARSIRAAGGRPGDILHNAYGYGLFTGGLGAHGGAEKLGCTVVPVSGGMTERQVQLITDFRPDIIMVTPSYMLNIIDELERVGVDPRSTSLRVGIFGAEPWTSEMRRTVEERLDMHAVDIYGLSEVIGPGVAQECVETKDGLHVWEDHFYPEIIDPITGEVLPDGEKGELVFTSLTKQAMPVLRYRTRDLTRLLPGTARPCAAPRRSPAASHPEAVQASDKPPDGSQRRVRAWSRSTTSTGCSRGDRRLTVRQAVTALLATCKNPPPVQTSLVPRCRRGRLDILGNIADVSWVEHFADGTVESYRRILSPNVDAPLFVIEAAIPCLVDSGGTWSASRRQAL